MRDSIQIKGNKKDESRAKSVFFLLQSKAKLLSLSPFLTNQEKSKLIKFSKTLDVTAFDQKNWKLNFEDESGSQVTHLVSKETFKFYQFQNKNINVTSFKSFDDEVIENNSANAIEIISDLVLNKRFAEFQSNDSSKETKIKLETYFALFIGLIISNLTIKTPLSFPLSVASLILLMFSTRLGNSKLKYLLIPVIFLNAINLLDVFSFYKYSYLNTLIFIFGITVAAIEFNLKVNQIVKNYIAPFTIAIIILLSFQHEISIIASGFATFLVVESNLKTIRKNSVTNFGTIVSVLVLAFELLRILISLNSNSVILIAICSLTFLLFPLILFYGNQNLYTRTVSVFYLAAAFVTKILGLN